MTGFIASAFLSRNRVSLKEAFEGLELCERKLSCTVLRGLDGSNPVRLLGNPLLTNLANSTEQPAQADRLAAQFGSGDDSGVEQTVRFGTWVSPR